MSNDNHRDFEPVGRPYWVVPAQEIHQAELAETPPATQARIQSPPPRRVWLPLLLLLATCCSTMFVGSLFPSLEGIARYGPLKGLAYGLWRGFLYAGPLMTILICHEMGHYLQARRYGVPCSLPYFIPVPIFPIGTFGAVIAMGARIGGRRALFDIGVTGPLAGLVPTLFCCIVGLYLSDVQQVTPEIAHSAIRLGDSLLFSALSQWIHGPLPPGHDVFLHPVAMAGWVGLLITSLNLIPIGQLDGGHILYALLRRRAAKVAMIVLLAAAVGIAYFKLWNWLLMLLLVAFMGPAHPPTANDYEPLGASRYVLGWLTLAFATIGFTPNPFPMH